MLELDQDYMQAALTTVAEGGTEALAMDQAPPSGKIHLLPRIHSRQLFARAPTMRREPSRDLMERARSGDLLPGDVPAGVHVDESLLRATSSLSMRSLRDKCELHEWPELREGGDLDEGARAARIAAVAQKAVEEVAARKVEQEADARVAAAEETTNEDTINVGVEVDELAKPWDDVPSSVPKRTAFWERKLGNLRKKRSEHAKKPNVQTSAEPAAATAERENKLAKLRSRVHLLGAKRKTTRAREQAATSCQTIREESSTSKEDEIGPSTPIKPTPSVVSEDPTLAHVIVTSVKVLSGDAVAEDPADTPTTAASATSTLPSPLADSVSTAYSNPVEGPSGLTPSPTKVVEEGETTEPTNGQVLLPPDMPIAEPKRTLEATSIERSDTYVSQEGQEQEDLSVVTEPDPEVEMLPTPASSIAEDEQDSSSGIGGGAEREEEFVPMEDIYRNSSRLQTLIEQKEIIGAKEECAEGKDAQEEAAIVGPAAKELVAEAPDSEKEGDLGASEDDDASLHIVYANEAHGVIGTSTDVLVEVSSLPEGDEDVEVIKCLGLDEIALESGVDAETEPMDDENAEEDADSQKQASKATKGSNKTAGTDGTTKSESFKASSSKLRNPAGDASPETPKSRSSRSSGRLGRLVAREKSERRPSGRFLRKKRLQQHLLAGVKQRSDNASEASRSKTGLSVEAREAVQEALTTPEGQDFLIITPVDAPVTVEHVQAVAGELGAIELRRQKTGLSPKARYALAEDRESADDVGSSRSQSQKGGLPPSRSNGTSDDEVTLDQYDWDLDTLDSEASTFVSEKSMLANGQQQCAFEPFGIPQEELVDDLMEAFDDTVGQFMSDIGLVKQVGDADSSGRVSERTKSVHGRNRAANRRSGGRNLDSHRSRNETDRRKRGGESKRGDNAPWDTRRMEV